jgi:hypothetical protein
MWVAQRPRARKGQSVCQLRRRLASRPGHHEQHRWQYVVNRPWIMIRIGSLGSTDNMHTLMPSAARRRRLVCCVSLKVRLLRPLKMIGSTIWVSAVQRTAGQLDTTHGRR